MKKYQRPLIALTAAVLVSSLMSACVVVPARGYYKYRYYGASATPAQVAPAGAPATAQA